MKNSRRLYWSLIIIGALAVLSSVYMYFKGTDFDSYFWGGFCGITLLGTAFINQNFNTKTSNNQDNEQ